MSRLVAVNLARVIAPGWKTSVGRTGIDKRSVTRRVQLADHRVEGDTVCDTRHHGGPDQAVYAYAREDAAWWANRLDRDVAPGAFGENLSTQGVDVTGAVIGERWRIGSALLEVSCPRIPCRTLAGFWDVKDMMTLFVAGGRPGAYLRIAAEGDVGAGDDIRVVHRPEHGVTIGETFRALTGEHTLAARMLQAPELPAQVHRAARRWLALRPAVT